MFKLCSVYCVDSHPCAMEAVTVLGFLDKIGADFIGTRKLNDFFFKISLSVQDIL